MSDPSIWIVRLIDARLFGLAQMEQDAIANLTAANINIGFATELCDPPKKKTARGTTGGFRVEIETQF